MRTSIYIIGILFLVACSGKPAKQADMAYEQKLNETKKYYPFEKWRESFSHGLTQYTEANCNKVKNIFDDLIDGLIATGENADEETKIALFKTAILKTNELDERIIETGEREDLCDLTNRITIACGLDPKKYGEGEGLATNWREW